MPVAEGAFASLRVEHLVRVGVVDHAEFRGVVDDEGDGDAAEVVALDEVRRAVDGVHDEELADWGEGLRRAFLPDEMRVGHDFQEALAQAFLHLFVVLRDEVGAAALGVDVKALPVDVLDEQAAGADEGRYGLNVSWLHYSILRNFTLRF